MLALAASAGTTEEDSVTFSDFTLSLGDRINIGNYQVELIEIQSVRDGIAVIRVSKVGGALDEQRAFLQNSANSFDGGAEEGGLTVTVTDILDEQSAGVRVEYEESLGTARKRASERPRALLDLPNLVVEKTFDRDQISVGDEVKVTVTVRNIGTGDALDISVEDLPPLPEFSYIAGYPPKIRERLGPGESDSAIYVMRAIKEGSIRVPAIQVKYTDSKKNAKINNSEPFNLLINPRGRPELMVTLAPSGPVPIDGKGVLNVSIYNAGRASASRVEVSADIRPPDGLDATGLEKSFFEIPPDGNETFSSVLTGRRAGNYTVRLTVSYQGGEATMIQEGQAEVIVLEREYKYLYLLLVLPVLAVAVWIYRRYREYKY